MKQKYFVISVSDFVCTTVLIICLIPGQTAKLFNLMGGTLFQAFYYSKYIAVLCMLAYAMMINRPRISGYTINAYWRSILPILVLMLLIECVSVFTSPVVKAYGARYYSRALSTFLDRFFIFFAVALLWRLRGEKTIKCVISALIIDQIVVLIAAIMREGIGVFVKAFVGAFTLGEGSTTRLEVHELTFCIGILLLYMIVTKNVKNRKGLFFTMAFFFIIGAKRIGMAGLAVACLVSLVIRKKGFSRKMLTIIGTIGVAICFIYIAIIYSGGFFTALYKGGINNMGREVLYGYFTRRTSFGFSQHPWGIAGVSKAIEGMTRFEVGNMVNVGGLHNDLLKIYINYGLFGYAIWLITNLIYLPLRITRIFGKESATVYMCLCIYMFVTYLTDNTEGYFVCQIMLFLLPLLVSTGHERKLENG